MPPRIAAPLRQQCRCFSTTPTTRGPPKTNALSLFAADASPPPYPYGRQYWYKQANHGLYGGVKIQFGNNVSDKTEIKTRRKWLPNIKHKQIYSRILGRTLRLKVSTRVLRTIDKVGGVDHYVLGDKVGRIRELGEEGWKLRWAMLSHPSMKKRARGNAKLESMVQSIQAEVTRKEMADAQALIDAEVASTAPVKQAMAYTAPKAREVVDEYMRENPPPPTVWQRTKNVLWPFGRR